MVPKCVFDWILPTLNLHSEIGKINKRNICLWAREIGLDVRKWLGPWLKTKS